MANTIRDYSATAASNTTVDGADISEGCSPAGINNAIRGVMADLKDVSTGAVSLESPAADSLSLSGALTTTSTIDGRDVAADGTKLDGVEASADVTDAGNVNPLVDAHLNQSTAASGELLSWNGSDYDWVTAGGGGDLLAANNLSDLASAGIARSNLGLGSAATTAASAYATAAQGTTADAALPRTGGAMTGAITTNSTFDGRDVATDGAKLDGIATGATAYGDSDVDTHLNTSTAATNEVLSWTGSDYDWVAQSGGGGGIANVVEDTSPQLGGDLDVNSKAINFGDSDSTTTNMLTFGAGDDLKIYHHATAGTYITESGTGNLNLRAGDLRLMNGSGFTTLRSQLSGIQISNSYTLPTADGTSGQVMTTDGAGTVSFTTVSGGGGSPDLFDESYDGTSTAPSATGTNSVAIGKGSTASGQESMAVLDGNAVSQDSFSVGGNVYANAIGGTQIGKGGIVGGYGFAANYGVSIGYQGIAAKTESIALGKAYSGGINSFAAQITNNTSSYGATGNNSIAMGQLSKATQANGVAIGTQTSSLATEGVSIGTQNTIYSPNGVGIGSTNSVLGTKGVGLGTSTYVSASYGMAFGFQSRAFQQSQFAFAAGNFASFGDAQGSMYILRCATTDATPTVLTTDGGASQLWNQIEVQTDQCLTFDGTITAMQNGAQSYASWRVEGLLVNDGGTTTVANSAITVIDNQSSWGLTLTADNTNNALAITFTGEAAHNIRAVANIRTSEVTYA